MTTSELIQKIKAMKEKYNEAIKRTQKESLIIGKYKYLTDLYKWLSDSLNEHSKLPKEERYEHVIKQLDKRLRSDKAKLKKQIEKIVLEHKKENKGDK
ncbi:hypothetical protein QVA60_02110 [Staphylococcus chromogenes]|uniref:hypothetical protein n=1 Tax=Staphylococcus chromogenes TaxID=46126 RepID=UPI002900F324|nr:hypothetical protein [Staphylococcus chromogenes]MDU0429279.1 hypothetical protein [Staphylococcus chromogenes]